MLYYFGGMLLSGDKEVDSATLSYAIKFLRRGCACKGKYTHDNTIKKMVGANILVLCSKCDEPFKPDHSSRTSTTWRPQQQPRQHSRQYPQHTQRKQRKKSPRQNMARNGVAKCTGLIRGCYHSSNHANVNVKPVYYDKRLGFHRCTACDGWTVKK